VRRWRQHPARIAAIASMSLLGIVVVASLPLFVFPARDLPSHADAIVVLSGDTRRLTLGRKLAVAGYASTLLVSTPSGICPPPIPRVRVLCFQPHPVTTQGEARYTAMAARKYGWKKLIVVSSTNQTTRARIRFKRCTDLEIRYVPAGVPVRQLPYRIAYEWGALAKALIFQRGC
jgi:hypothetical protein